MGGEQAAETQMPAKATEMMGPVLLSGGCVRRSPGLREACEEGREESREAGWAWQRRGRLQVEAAEREQAGTPRLAGGCEGRPGNVGRSDRPGRTVGLLRGFGLGELGNKMKRNFDCIYAGVF